MLACDVSGLGELDFFWFLGLEHFVARPVFALFFPPETHVTSNAPAYLRDIFRHAILLKIWREEN